MPNAASSFGATALLCAAAALFASPGARARIPSAQFERIELGGFRSGMRAAEVDKILLARRGLSEPNAGIGMAYDCDSLASDAPNRPFSVAGRAGWISQLDFSEGPGHNYQLHFAPTPSGPVVSLIGYTVWGIDSSWDDYLAAAERTYGKAERVGAPDRDGAITAIWCEESQYDCISGRGRGGRLALTWRALAGRLVGNGIANRDAVNFELFPGRDREDARDEAIEATLDHDPAGARRLQADCKSATLFADEAALARHVTGLAHALDRESPTVWKPRQVPPAVFKALNIDAATTFADGMCFNSTDVIFEMPGCKGSTSIGFRWARQAGDRWLVALAFGGVVRRQRYYLVRKTPDGSFRKLWWDHDLAALSGWLAAGAVPMTGETW